MDFNNDFTAELNSFWGQLFSYNYYLMNFSKNEALYGSETFQNVMDFYLTSQAISFIKGCLLNHIGSLGMLLSARGFLEGLALKRMYYNGKISELNVELLRYQVHLIEYNYYKQFDDIGNEILIPEKLIKDRDNSILFFKEKLSNKFTDKEIKEFILSSKPFLCDKNKNFRKLIAENLGEDFATLYGLYSQAIHPSINTFYSDPLLWDVKTIEMTVNLIKKEFPSLKKTSLTFYNYYNSTFNSQTSINFIKSFDKEYETLIKISNVFKEFFHENYVSNTLISIALLLKEICSDLLAGLREQIKSKWKILLDIFSSFYECYICNITNENKIDLLEEHTFIQIFRNIGDEYSIDRAFDIYKTIYTNGIDRTNFKKRFLSVSGYTIDENGMVKSLTGLVKDFIDKFKSKDTNISWDRVMLLDYMESQMLSHANGYMWYANQGAWQDTNNIIIGTDICLSFILERIFSMFKIHKITDENNLYKPIINVVRNGIKEIKALCNEKSQLLQMPPTTF